MYTKTGFNAEVAVKLTFEVTVDDTQTLKNKPNATGMYCLLHLNLKSTVFKKKNHLNNFHGNNARKILKQNKAIITKTDFCNF